ncbi:MAG: leucine-rich repeat domain-containing protein [Holosporales bacterium]|nr:leucine-rich repeat domain-containing protein [Holosporales bacterium]
MLRGEIQEIGPLAFRCCTVLSRVDLPEGLESIDWGAFTSCAISEITIPESVVWFGKEAFIGCPLRTITFCSSPDVIRSSRGKRVAGSLEDVFGRIPGCIAIFPQDIVYQCDENGWTRQRQGQWHERLRVWLEGWFGAARPQE